MGWGRNITDSFICCYLLSITTYDLLQVCGGVYIICREQICRVPTITLCISVRFWASAFWQHMLPPANNSVKNVSWEKQRTLSPYKHTRNVGNCLAQCEIKCNFKCVPFCGLWINLIWPTSGPAAMLKNCKQVIFVANSTVTPSFHLG